MRWGDRCDERSAVEHRPADVVPQPLVVEHELADRVRELVTLPPALASSCALALSFRRGSTCGLDRIGGRTELVRGDVCDGRGLAVKLYLEDGSRTDLVSITLPRFFVRNPEDFLEFTRARKPDPETGQPDMGKIGAFLEAHPEALPAIQHALSQPAPASYAQLDYHGIHAFKWIARDGTERPIDDSAAPMLDENFEVELNRNLAMLFGRAPGRRHITPTS